MNIGNAIKVVRTAKDISRSELARKAEVSVSYLSLLERDEREPSLGTIRKIAAELNIPLSILIYMASDHSEIVGLDKDLTEKLSENLMNLIYASRQKTLLPE